MQQVINFRGRRRGKEEEEKKEKVEEEKEKHKDCGLLKHNYNDRTVEKAITL